MVRRATWAPVLVVEVDDDDDDGERAIAGIAKELTGECGV